jgi:hypothetical protein
MKKQTMKDFIYEKEIFFSDFEIFQDNNEHAYNCKCYDGYAVCNAVEPNEMKKTFRVTYPLRKEVLKNEQMCKEVLEYRGLYDLTKTDIHFGDIMVTYGKIEK